MGAACLPAGRLSGDARMWPRIGPVTTYGTLYLTGIVLHFLASRWIAKQYGLKRRVWVAAGVCYLVGMVLGAKLLYDVRHGSLDVATLLDAQHYLHGGMWGGLLAYLLLAVPMVLLLARDRPAALDLVGMSIPIPWMAAKVGCLLNGCCYGKPCSLPWAITFPEGARGAPAGVPLHPSQLYEVGLMVVILLVFVATISPRWRGTKLLWFLAIYGVGRAATDMLRGDTEGYRYLGFLSLTQMLCLAAAIGAYLALALWTHRTRPGRRQYAREDSNCADSAGIG